MDTSGSEGSHVINFDLHKAVVAYRDVLMAEVYRKFHIERVPTVIRRNGAIIEAGASVWGCLYKLMTDPVPGMRPTAECAFRWSGTVDGKHRSALFKVEVVNADTLRVHVIDY